MNEITVFKNEQFGEVRTVMQDGEPWFVGKDVAAILGYTDLAHTILDHVEEEDRVNSKTQGQNNPEFGQRGTWLINESGLYSLVLSSKLPAAREFKRWVTSDVLPTIRRHGVYAMDELLNNPDFLIKALTDLKEERERRRQLEEENAAQSRQLQAAAPKVVFADAVSASRTSILVGELAKLLRQNGVEIGQKRLFKWLRQHEYLMKTGSSYNMPTQYAMELGLFEIKEGSIANPDGSIRITKTPKVTGRGQQYFVNLFLNRATEGTAGTTGREQP